MINTLQSAVSFFSIATLSTSLVAIFMVQAITADSAEKVYPKLPEQINGWRAASRDRVYDPDTIFGYINGGAEVYKAYNMRSCFSRRYSAADGAEIILDIFDMGSSQDAFGVFTHDTDGKMVTIGQGGRLRPGWLSFWKDRFFISIYAQEDTDAIHKTIIDLAAKIAAGIPESGAKPKILSRLPAEGLKSDSIRYLHHPVLLNYHYYISDENILQISGQTDVVLADYLIAKEQAILLLVVYPDNDKAAASRASFLKHYLPDADVSGATLMENGKWAAIQSKDRLVAIVLEADNRDLAARLLGNVRWNFEHPD
jgi:hypothetical protein